MRVGIVTGLVSFVAFDTNCKGIRIVVLLVACGRGIVLPHVRILATAMRIALLLVTLATSLCMDNAYGAKPQYVRIDAANLQEEVIVAAPHSVMIADRTRQVEVLRTVRIDKPLTLVGLNMRLAPGLAETPILEVLSENVRIRDFILEGNGDSVTQAERAPLIVLRRGRFVIENGQTNNSAKDGMMITPIAEYGDIEHGVIRNITARNTIRDTVSIGGRGNEGLYVRHLLVENIRSYGSEFRGPVEVSDGSEHITVRDIYSESSFYGVDIQDHGQPGMVNRHIVIDGVQVKDCVTAVRTANRDFGHDGLAIRNVTGVDWREHEQWSPLHIRNTSNLVLENIRIDGNPELPSLFIQNSNNVSIRNVTIVNASQPEAAVVVEDSDNVLLDNIVIVGDKQPGYGIVYRIRSDEQFGGLRIRNVLEQDVGKSGILLENLSKSGGLDSYSITGNLASVDADLPARRRLVEGNL